MSDLIQNVTHSFNQVLGYAPTHIIQAPGRVNLIGEHTDYNDGFVLPCAINYQTMVAAAKRDDNIVRVVSVDYDNAVDEFDITQEIIFQQDKMWANYIRGVVKYLLARGYQFTGADISVSGNVPQGAGLSSSAALEVVIGQTFKVLFNLEISQADIALNGQQAENQFVGCNCGIMDQMISAEGRENHAMLLDCRSLEQKLSQCQKIWLWLSLTQIRNVVWLTVNTTPAVNNVKKRLVFLVLKRCVMSLLNSLMKKCLN